MKKVCFILMALLALSSCRNTPDFVLVSADRISELRKEFKKNPSQPEFTKLIKACDSLLSKAPHSVMDKGVMPPSGDKHDYMSQGPYWWPNPDTPDGRPYIRRDGETNPESRLIRDDIFMRDMNEDIKFLALAYYLSGEEKYAAKATEFLKVWFLNPETRMNPNLNFGQCVPGVYDNGRGIGIIDLNRMNEMYDHIRMISDSKAWDSATDSAFKDWITEFTEWLVTSDHGINEKGQPNNHGTYYDLLVCTSYLFIGQKDKASEYVSSSMPARFDEITAEGAQPRELARTNGWTYSLMNLRGLLLCATAAEKAGVDMWHYKNIHGAGIQTAIDWYKPYVLEGKEWDYKEISHKFNPSGILYPLAISSERCDISAYSDFISNSEIQGINFLFYPSLKK